MIFVFDENRLNQWIMQFKCNSLNRFLPFFSLERAASFWEHLFLELSSLKFFQLSLFPSSSDESGTAMAFLLKCDEEKLIFAICACLSTKVERKVEIICLIVNHFFWPLFEKWKERWLATKHILSTFLSFFFLDEQSNHPILFVKSFLELRQNNNDRNFKKVLGSFAFATSTVF